VSGCQRDLAVQSGSFIFEAPPPPTQGPFYDTKKVLVASKRKRERKGGLKGEEPKNVKDDTDAFYFYFTRAFSVPPQNARLKDNHAHQH